MKVILRRTVIAMLRMVVISRQVRQHPGVEWGKRTPDFVDSRSDPQAIAMADLVMERFGGHTYWEATRYITGQFFGGRRYAQEPLRSVRRCYSASGTAVGILSAGGERDPGLHHALG